MTTGAEMEIQLLDAEACQIALDGPRVVRFRQGTARWDDPSLCWREVDRKAKVEEASYLVRLWGRTRDGKSVCVVVCDAVSTFYRRLSTTHSPSRLAALADKVAEYVANPALGPSGATVDVVYRHTTNGWIDDPADPSQPAKLPWMRIVASNQATRLKIPTASRKAENDLALVNAFLPITAEKSVEVHNELLLKLRARPGGWITLNSRVVQNAKESMNRAVCHLCIHALTKDIRAVGSGAEAAPIRVLSYDIECYSESKCFPDPLKIEDPIIAISLYEKTMFSENADEKASVVYLGDAILPPESTVANHEVYSCKTEVDLLCRFAELFRLSDADVIVGYNTCLFDWRYIAKRVTLLLQLGQMSRGKAEEIFRLSRVRSLHTPSVENAIASSAMGDNPLHHPRMPGRFEVDLWFYLKRQNNPGLPNLKLDTVSAHYLGTHKHDLPAQQMFIEHCRSPEGRGLVAAYCIQDTKLVMDLVEKLDVIPSVLQMASVTGVTPHDINFRGQQIKVYTQILDKAHELGYVVEDTGGDNQDNGFQQEYEGAHVVDPTVGYYRDPILTLDFASLYPSLIQTYNLSFDTRVISAETAAPSLLIPNTSHRFVASSVRRGLLPLILDGLLAERKRVRKIAAQTSDKLQKSLLNCMQLALKVSANSCYGFTGSTKGLMTCIEVAESTTGAGRDIIHFSSKTIEREWPGSEVVYGDTDSCFVRLPPHLRDLDDYGLFDLGEEMANKITKEFAAGLQLSQQSFVLLEMEKFLRPLALYKKKRYAGLCYEEPGKEPKMCAKGIEMVRRDAAPLLRKVQEDVLDAIIRKEDAEAGVAIAKSAVESVLALPPGGPFDDIAQSKTLKANYACPQSMAHVQVVNLMNTRDPGSAPRVGERVFFVVIASETPRVVDKVDDVAYAQEEKLPPDWLHYVEMLERPLMRLLDVPLMSLGPDKLQALEKFFDAAKSRARAQVRVSSLARHGAGWLRGHKSTRGTQLKLNTIPKKQEEQKSSNTLPTKSVVASGGGGSVDVAALPQVKTIGWQPLTAEQAAKMQTAAKRRKTSSANSSCAAQKSTLDGWLTKKPKATELPEESSRALSS